MISLLQENAVMTVTILCMRQQTIQKVLSVTLNSNQGIIVFLSPELASNLSHELTDEGGFLVLVCAKVYMFFSTLSPKYSN